MQVQAVKPSSAEIVAMWRAEPGLTLGQLQVRTRIKVGAISKILKAAGITTTKRAGSGAEDEEGLVNDLTESQWGLVAGMLLSQKTCVYVKGPSTRILVTNARPERLLALRDLLGVGEVNCFPTNGGKNIQHVYRVGQGAAVRAILTEVRSRSLVEDEAIVQALAVLAANDGYSKDSEYEEGTEGSYGPD